MSDANLLLTWNVLSPQYARFADALLWTVCAHSFPVWSGGTHGPTAELVTRLRPLLKRHGAHYMSGHDHVSSFHDEGLGPVFVVAGNGDNCCYNASHAPALPENSTKFGAHTPLCYSHSSAFCPAARHCLLTLTLHHAELVRLLEWRILPERRALPVPCQSNEQHCVCRLPLWAGRDGGGVR